MHNGDEEVEHKRVFIRSENGTAKLNEDYCYVDQELYFEEQESGVAQATIYVQILDQSTNTQPDPKHFWLSLYDPDNE